MIENDQSSIFMIDHRSESKSQTDRSFSMIVIPITLLSVIYEGQPFGPKPATLGQDQQIFPDFFAD